ncbi:MAG: DsbA family protein [Thermodesulfobacteriota bacterium]
MKSYKPFSVLIITFLSLLLIVPSFSYAGVEEDISELKREISTVKKELNEIKKFLRSRLQAPAQPPTPSFSEASIDDDRILGNKDAPVTIIEFSDYQCPFCARFYRDTLPQLKKDYIEKGKVRYVLRDFPLPFHKKAQKAAESAQCAGEQDKYWDMHNLIFENQQAMSIRDLKGYAEQLSLNTVDFNKCLDDGIYAEEVKKDMAAGKKAGVQGTPSFVVGKTTKDGNIKGNFIRGAQPYPAFKSAIDSILNEN